MNPDLQIIKKEEKSNNKENTIEKENEIKIDNKKENEIIKKEIEEKKDNKKEINGKENGKKEEDEKELNPNIVIKEENENNNKEEIAIDDIKDIKELNIIIDNEKEKEKEESTNSINTSISSNNNIYSNLFTSEEIVISFKKSKTELDQILSRDIYRCHLCKELMTTQIKYEGEFINIDYSCPNHHFGSLDIGLFLSKIVDFSFIYAQCSKCGLYQKNSKEIFYFCKDCEEIYCPKDIKDCRLAKENIVSLEDLDYLCILHKKDYNSYCEECNENLCEICAESNEHKNHKKYYFKEKLIGQKENDDIDRFISQGRTTKNKFEEEIVKLFSRYSKENIEELILNMKNNIKENLEIYGNLIFYSYNIKKAYDFCVKCNRYNHQIITNLYELVKNQLHFIEKKFSEINRYILQLNQNMYIFSLKKEEDKPKVLNKEGFRIKDHIFNNNSNNIKINIDKNINTSTNNNNESKKKIIKKYIFEDGEYEGEIRDGLPHGKGTYKYKNGDEYIGEFKNGLFDGNGEHIMKNGDNYTGQFKKGKKEGNGIYKSFNGESYSGYWKDNKRDGEGKYCFSNGDSYQGEFKEDMFNGKGTMFYSNGNKTIGMWQNNKRNGIEVLFNNKGEIYFHFYENNTLIQEKKLDNSQKDFRDFTDEKMNELMNNFYQKQLKKK